MILIWLVLYVEQIIIIIKKAKITYKGAILAILIWLIHYWSQDTIRLKKLRQAEEGANIFGVFRVKNHDFTPKNHIFSNFRGGARRMRPLDPPLKIIYFIRHTTDYIHGVKYWPVVPILWKTPKLKHW